MTCLNNNVDILIPYKLPSSGLEEIPPREIQYCETDQVKMRQTHPIILVITSDFFLLKKKKFSAPTKQLLVKRACLVKCAKENINTVTFYLTGKTKNL